MARMSRRVTAVLSVAILLWAGAAWAGHEDGRVLVVAPPLARADALWMAAARGFFKDEGLSVTVRWVSSGREALQALNQSRDKQAGAVAFVVVGEMLALDAWQSTEGEFAVVAPLARDADGYVVVARATVRSPDALRAAGIATQLGSTAAWVLGEYLRAHGMSERDVALKHEPPEAILSWDPTGPDIAAFVVREPYATRALQKNGDAVHRLATAKGYAHGYLVLGASRQYLREHAGVAERLLRALDRGRRHAAEHRDDVIAFARDMFGTEPAVVDVDYAATERLLGVDPTVVSDMRNLVHWMKEAGLLGAPADPRTLFELGPLRATFPERLAADDPPTTR